MERTITVISTLLILLATAACQKKDDTLPQPSKVSISITSPAEGQVYGIGDTINIAAHVSYISQLHGYYLKISDSHTGQVYYQSEDHVHGDHFDVQQQWISTLSQPAQLQLELTTEIDHKGNEAKQSRLFEIRM